MLSKSKVSLYPSSPDLLLTVGFHLSCTKVSCINHSIDALYLPFNEGIIGQNGGSLNT